MSKYRVHMVSFENTEEGGHNVIIGMQNAQPWHIIELERYIQQLKESLESKPGSEFA